MRDLIVIGVICAASILVGTVLFYFGPSSLRSDVSSAISVTSTSTPSFVTIAQGPRALSITDRINYRITTQQDLETLWTQIYGSGDTPQLPSVDFDKYEVLALFDGSHASGGYGITATALTDQGGTRTITIDHQEPGDACPSVPQESSPFQLIRVPKTVFTLAHIDTMHVSTCR